MERSGYMSNEQKRRQTFRQLVGVLIALAMLLPLNQYNEINAKVNHIRNIIAPPERLQPVGPVLDYDAKALRRAIRNVKVGGTLDLKDKIYNLKGESVVIDKGMTLKGSGKIINGSIKIQNTSQVTIEGITTSNFIIDINQATHVKITQSSFQGVRQDVSAFITVYGHSQDIHITHNQFKDIRYISSSSAFGSGVRVTAHKVTMRQIKIEHNQFSDIYGPAAIFIGGHGSKLSEISVSYNTIKDTENFGIEIYQYQGVLDFSATVIAHNELTDIGGKRQRNIGNGASGIYNNITSGDVKAINNEVRRVLEVGIEGYYSLVDSNYIEDTGSDQLNHPIEDSAGIYAAGPVITNNTIVNPGGYGGIHYYSKGIISNKTITNNRITNQITYWSANTPYQVGDLVVHGGRWYVATKSGQSSLKNPSGKGKAIVDGTVVWDYKKPVAQAGINFNGEDGLSDFAISHNEVSGFKNFASLSAFLKNIHIHRNDYDTTMLSATDVGEYVVGYGNRQGPTINISY